ncbi:MAG TPA: hypothetical protein VEI03_19675 [Stellaceae bacterium]|nr:hypothetical protein [Stellaceae bacterium]
MLLLGLAFVAAAPEAASAALLGDARVAYSAERTVTVNGKSYSGMVFHSPGHERHEQTIAGIAEVVILDVAMKRGFLVVPMLKSYVAFAFPPLMAKLDDPGLRSAPIGRETVNGVPTTKYRIDHLSADGSRAHGYVWLSVQGVLMRIDGTVTRDGAGKPLAIRMELANLVLGSQDPALFQVPPGLVELPAAAFEGLFGRGSG